jgi:hypothetical protein
MSVNEIFGWFFVTGGLLAGLGLGLGFHRDEWLGGYASLRRRLVRLAHISLVALGFLNILFGLSAPRLRLEPATLAFASWTLVAGGAGMPVCCALAAWRPGLRHLFAVPVLSLLLGVGTVLWRIVRP